MMPGVSADRCMPTIRIEGTAYFIDLSGRQFREPMDPSSRVDFDSVKGERFCRKAGVVTCLGCGASVIIGVGLADEDLRCVSCRAVIRQ